MKYFTYILRNARRNPVRSMLTVASTGICLFLMMILLSFFAINDEATAAARIHNRIASLNANGFAGMIPISRVKEIAQLDGIIAASPFCWIGGKYQDEIMPFAQFGVDADTVFTIMDELTIPPEQLKAFQENKDGCVIGRKLATEKKLKVNDVLPLKGDAYPVDLSLTIRGIYDGPGHTDLRMCLVRWDYFDEVLKRVVFRGSSSTPASARISGNAGMIFIKCKTGDDMAPLCKKIDGMYRNSDFPMRTQTEEAFGKMFEEMLGDMKGMIRIISLAVIVSLLCVAGNSMAMAMRERTCEVAVLKAIGFSRRLVLFMVLAEAVLVAGFGGIIGSLGSKALCDVVDLSRFTAGFLPFYYVPWDIALEGVTVSLLIGLASGLYPAVRAANLSVVDGLRRVI
ncbi:MAG: ABC transporter permease [Isosphaerales bacterium]